MSTEPKPPLSQTFLQRNRRSGRKLYRKFRRQVDRSKSHRRLRQARPGQRQAYLDLHRGLAAAERDAERLMAESFARADFQEGVQSYLQRRPPEFRRVGAESPPSY